MAITFKWLSITFKWPYHFRMAITFTMGHYFRAAITFARLQCITLSGNHFRVAYHSVITFARLSHSRGYHFRVAITIYCFHVAITFGFAWPSVSPNASTFKWLLSAHSMVHEAERRAWIIALPSVPCLLLVIYIYICINDVYVIMIQMYETGDMKSIKFM